MSNNMGSVLRKEISSFFSSIWSAKWHIVLGVVCFIVGQYLLYDYPRIMGALLFFFVMFLFFIRKWLAGVVIFLGICVLARSRYVEPYWLNISETDITIGCDSTFVLISDLHLGQHKNEEYLTTVIREINALSNIDAVLIAGDFMSAPSRSSIPLLYGPLSESKYPLYAVLGNHDIEKPGPPRRGDLEGALKKNGVTLLNNNIVSIGDITLIGLGDMRGYEDDVSIIPQNTTGCNIVLTHNPDTVLSYQEDMDVDITLAGHTHCGQVKIPLLWKVAAPVNGPYRCGLYDDQQTVFVTSGLGESILPLRLFNRPTIDVLHFQ